MSALIGYVTLDAAHLFTDGGHYHPETIAVSRIGPKVAIIPQHNAAVGFTGHAFISQALPLYFGQTAEVADATDLITRFPDLIKTCVLEMSKIGGPKSWGRFEMLLAVWSENGPAAHLLRSDGSNFTYEAVDEFRTPRNPAIDTMSFDPDHPGPSGLAIMREQRRQKFGVESAVSNHRDALRNMMARPDDRTDAFQVVHGFCQHTWVDRDGVHSKILERWD